MRDDDYPSRSYVPVSIKDFARNMIQAEQQGVVNIPTKTILDVLLKAGILKTETRYFVAGEELPF